MGFVCGSPQSCAGSTRGEGFFDGPTKFRFESLCVRRCGRDDVGIMNGAVHGRRLASPVRLALATELGAPLDGAWWPHTASVARELPELIDALSARLGEIIAISVNWSSLEGSPDLDALK